MRIGEASAASGVPERMIRHYEKLGMVPEATRTSGGYRDYGDDDVARLRLIAQSRNLGVPLDEVRDLLSAEGGAPADIAKRWKVLLREKETALADLRELLDRL